MNMDDDSNILENDIRTLRNALQHSSNSASVLLGLKENDFATTSSLSVSSPKSKPSYFYIPPKVPDDSFPEDEMQLENDIRLLKAYSEGRHPPAHIFSNEVKDLLASDYLAQPVAREKPSSSFDFFGNSHFMDSFPFWTSYPEQSSFEDSQPFGDSFIAINSEELQEIYKTKRINESLQNFVSGRIAQIQEYLARSDDLERRLTAMLNKAENHGNDLKINCNDLMQFLKMGSSIFSQHPDFESLGRNLAKQNISLRPSKWTEKEKFLLAKGIRQENQRILMENVLLKYKNVEMSHQTMEMVKRELEEIKRLSPVQLEMNVDGIDWNRISSGCVMSKDPISCKIQWTVNDHPLINKAEWSKQERAKLAEIIKANGIHGWESIAEKLGTNRTASQCLIEYQRNLNKNLLKSKWTEEEDRILTHAVTIFGEKSWQTVSSYLEGRTGQQCLHRWQKALHPGIRRGRWTQEEDEALSAAVKLHGAKNWFKIKSYVKGRTDVQCRERYMNVLNPALNMGPWTADEDSKLKELVRIYGTGKWASISSEMISRTDNQCWRRWKALNVDQYLANERPSKRKLSITCPSLSTEKIDTETYVLENFKFNNQLLSNTDQAKTEARKYRFPKAKYHRIMDQFQISEIPREDPIIPPKQKNIPAFPAEVCTAAAFKNIIAVAQNSGYSEQVEHSNEHFKLLKKRFRALFFWPMLISKCDLHGNFIDEGEEKDKENHLAEENEFDGPDSQEAIDKIY